MTPSHFLSMCHSYLLSCFPLFAFFFYLLCLYFVCKKSEAQPLADWLSELHPNCSTLLSGFCLRGISFLKLQNMEATELDSILTSMEVGYGQRRAVMTAHALTKVNADEEEVENLLDEEDGEDEDEDSGGEEDEEDEEGGKGNGAEAPNVDTNAKDVGGGLVLPPIHKS
jgi:hypothetical protein